MDVCSICLPHRLRGLSLLATCGFLSILLVGCDGPQSALEPAGRGAEQIAQLLWWMTVGAVIIWLAVVGLAIYTIHLEHEPHSLRGAKLLIVGGGVIFPTLVLTILLAYGLALLPGLVAPAPAGSLKVAVSGEQWWWRVRYFLPGGETVELANEIRLPVGEPVEFHLDSPDVIHSFWIPPLGGKIDMIPGRVNRLVLEPTKTGVFRGVCAEYCGTSHALMAFPVVVQEKTDFSRWLAQQAMPAPSPTAALTSRGQEVFIANGCGACHTIRGTPADGVVGPDLTHVGGRLSLGAGTLANESADFVRWIAHTQTVKPDVQMPAFGMLPPDDLNALAAYLESLQ
jgi:cytochrome c oxidase subunit II